MKAARSEEILDIRNPCHCLSFSLEDDCWKAVIVSLDTCCFFTFNYQYGGESLFRVAPCLVVSLAD